MRSYARISFRNNMGEADPERIARFLATAAEELKSMEYYHSVRESKLSALASGPEVPMGERGDAAPSSLSSGEGANGAHPHGTTHVKRTFASQGNDRRKARGRLKMQ